MLEKVLGDFDGRGWLGKVLARLHARLPGGLGWDWCPEIALGGCTEKVFRVFLPRTARKKYFQQYNGTPSHGSDCPLHGPT